ncbi:hypothetical protein PRUB_b1116 [Pseudoalteromonas rubra]|uniref:Endonuclease/exonuclease/phosphatase domain-containing protein n=1 Tax=Pseudoalteromonas rubra TaxID=43658 RepID=A0A8T0C1N3_9GAMM|nr:endonuclease/exonuclease/phosphatase family protein [Pseudoalteromonas rubra]KAF7781786.1 hypothetical protein PRUB_b1116 [Pseudoalteromonas rubra]
MSNQFNVLSMNTHLFVDSSPGFFDTSLIYLDKQRAEKIIELSNGNFNVIGLTEVWGDKMRRQMATAFDGYNTFIPQADSKTAFVAGSPGMTLSVKGQWAGGYQPSFVFYQDMVGADKLAFKGVSTAITRVNGQVLGLVQTHAQASYTETEKRDTKARDRQFRQTLFPAIVHLQNLLESLSIKAPIILLGDLNVVADTNEYKWFLNELEQLGFYDCWTKVNGSQPGYTYEPRKNALVKRWDKTQVAPQRLDYIFLNPNNSGYRCTQMSVLSQWKLTTATSDSDLSDHYPVSACFEKAPA